MTKREKTFLALSFIAIVAWFGFTRRQTDITLSGLDLFFIGTTIFSIVLNIVQYLGSKPTYSTLIGLFNDIEYKVQRAIERRDKFHEAGHGEAAEYCDEVIFSLRGFHEEVVAGLKAIQPEEERWHAVRFGEKQKESRTNDKISG